MGTTPVFGFPYPDPSDLVANYPALGQQLAEDVEDEIIAAGGGLVPLATATPAAASSTIFDSVFSTTYQQYAIFWNLVCSATLNLQMRLRSGSPAADDTGSNYQNQFLSVNSTTVSASRSVNQDLGSIGSLRTNNIGNLTILNGPNMATVTSTASPTQVDYAGGSVTDFQLITYLTAMNTLTQYTGINIFVSGGTFTGTIKLFGVKQ